MSPDVQPASAGFTLGLVGHLVVLTALRRAIGPFPWRQLRTVNDEDGHFYFLAFLNRLAAISAFLLHNAPYICGVNAAGFSANTPFSG